MTTTGPFDSVVTAAAAGPDGGVSLTYTVTNAGDLVLAVDGRPIDELIAEQERFVFASTCSNYGLRSDSDAAGSCSCRQPEIRPARWRWPPLA